MTVCRRSAFAIRPEVDEQDTAYFDSRRVDRIIEYFRSVSAARTGTVKSVDDLAALQIIKFSYRKGFRHDRMDVVINTTVVESQSDPTVSVRVALLLFFLEVR